MTSGPTRDAVLVTVDCFRYDAPSEMPNLQSLVGDDDIRTEAIAASSSTPFVSPALMQSRLFPDVLSDAGGAAYTRYSVDDAVASLPRVLSGAGYSTGAFIAANPYLRQYADHFDAFWDGFDETKFEGAGSDLYKWASRLKRTLLLRKRVSGGELVSRAADWYSTAEPPRFLWMHFMEPHFPYYPGLWRGLDVGLLDAYRANLRLFRSDDRAESLPDADVEVIRSLYRECLGRVDGYLPDALSFLDDDALVAVTGDHGEAFDHGWITHVGLYDETVRVPLFLLNFPDSESDGRPVRQLDIPPTFLDALGLRVPTEWEGVPASGARPLLALLARPGSRESDTRVSVGLRTDGRKLIRHYDFADGAFVESELYDLDSDPEESTDRYDPQAPPAIQDRLDERLADGDLLEKLERFRKGHRVDDDPNVDDRVEDRLAELGYK